MLNFLDRAPALRAVLMFLVRVGDLADTLIHEIGHALVQLPFGTPLPSIKIHNLSGEATTYAYEPLLLSFVPRWLAPPFTLLFRILTLLSGYSASILLGVLLIAAGLGREFSFTPLWAVVIALATVAALLMSTPLPGLGLPVASTSSVLFFFCLFIGTPATVTLSGEVFGVTILFGVCVLLLLCSRSLLCLFLTITFSGACFGFYFLGAVIPFGWVLVFLGAVFVVAGLNALTRVTIKSFRDEDDLDDFVIASSEFGGHRRLWLAVFYVGFAVILFNLIPALMTP